MPETDRNNELSTAQITSKLAQLKLVKDRSIKDIDTNLNDDGTKKFETRKSLDDNTDDDEDIDPPPDKEESVCVKKIMQVNIEIILAKKFFLASNFTEKEFHLIVIVQRL